MVAKTTVVIRDEGTTDDSLLVDEDEEDEFEDFLDRHHLEPYAEAIHEYGIMHIADLYDEDILSDNDLAESIGMSKAEIDRFRSILSSHPLEVSAQSFNVNAGVVAKTAVVVRDEGMTDDSLLVDEDEEDEFEDFLDRHHLEPYAEAIHEYGIMQIADLYDEDILSNNDLAESISMSTAEIDRFRSDPIIAPIRVVGCCILIYHTHTKKFLLSTRALFWPCLVSSCFYICFFVLGKPQVPSPKARPTRGLLELSYRPFA